jgi:hypothetical protein
MQRVRPAKEGNHTFTVARMEVLIYLRMDIFRVCWKGYSEFVH